MDRSYVPRRHMELAPGKPARLVWDEAVFHIVQNLSDGGERILTGPEPKAACDYILLQQRWMPDPASIATVRCLGEEGCWACTHYRPIPIPDDDALGALITSRRGVFWVNIENARKRESERTARLSSKGDEFAQYQEGHI